MICIYLTIHTLQLQDDSQHGQHWSVKQCSILEFYEACFQIPPPHNAYWMCILPRLFGAGNDNPPNRLHKPAKSTYSMIIPLYKVNLKKKKWNNNNLLSVSTKTVSIMWCYYQCLKFFMIHLTLIWEAASS